MKKIFFVMFVILLISNISALGYHYKLLMNNNESGFFISKIDVGIREHEEKFGGDYLAEIISFDNKILYSKNFETKEQILIEGDLGNGYFESKIIKEDLDEISLQLPYFENTKEIVIYDENLTEVARRDISAYSKIREEENKTAKLNETKKETPTNIDITKNVPEALNYWWVLLIILILLIIILFYSLKKSK